MKHILTLTALLLAPLAALNAADKGTTWLVNYDGRTLPDATWTAGRVSESVAHELSRYRSGDAWDAVIVSVLLPATGLPVTLWWRTGCASLRVVACRRVLAGRANPRLCCMSLIFKGARRSAGRFDSRRSNYLATPCNPSCW